MKISISFFLLAFYMLVFYPNIIHAQQQTSVNITVYELVKIAVDNIEKSDLLKKELISFERTRIEYELDRGGNRESTLERTVTYHGKAYPIDQRTDDKLVVDFNKLLLKSYDYFSLDPANPANKGVLNKFPYECENCYLLRFRPKVNLPDIEEIAPPGSGAIEKGINETAMRMNGIIYIDKDHFFIRKYIGGLDGGFNKYGVTRVTRAFLDLEQEVRPDLNNIIVIKSVKLMFQFRTFFLSHLTREHEYKYSNHRSNP